MGLHANPQVNLIRCRIKAMLNMQAHAGDFGQNKLKKNNEETEAHMYSKKCCQNIQRKRKSSKMEKGTAFLS